jgi:hypothetical protein
MGKKNHMVISLDAEKAFEKIQHSFMIKTEETRNRRNIFSTLKVTYHIILNGKKLEPFPLQSVITQRCQLFPLLLNIVLQLLARAIGEEKKIKEIEIEKEEVKLSLIALGINLNLKDPKNYTKNS